MDAPQDCTLPLLDGYSKNKRPAWVPRRLWRARELLQHWTPVNLVFFSVVFGLLTGVVALTYNSILDWILDGTWSAFPKHAFLPLIEHLHSRWDWFPEPGSVAFVYVLIVATLYGTLAGVVQAYMGYPGDLPDSIELLHEKGYIPIQQAPSQFLCSSFSIASGASLGPEAPILSICAATTGWVSSRVFGHTGAMLRACTLMGMASGLSALFGVGLGGECSCGKEIVPCAPVKLRSFDTTSFVEAQRCPCGRREEIVAGLCHFKASFPIAHRLFFPTRTPRFQP